MKSHPMADVIAKYTAEATTACIVDVMVTKAQQERLWVFASEQKVKEKQGEPLSSEITIQDALSAYLIGLQRRCYDTPVNSVMYMMNVSNEELI